MKSLSLFICVLKTVRLVTAQTCTCPKELNVDVRVSDHGGMDGFYSIAQGISYAIQPKLSDATVNDLCDAIRKDKKADDILKLVIERLKNEHIPSMAFCGFGILICVCSFLFGLSVFCARCCNPSRKRYEGSKTPETSPVLDTERTNRSNRQDQISTCAITWQLILLTILIVSAIFVTLSIVLNNKSSSEFFASTESSPRSIKLMKKDVIGLYDNASETLICAFDKAIDKTLDEVKRSVQTAPKLLLDELKNLTGITTLDQINMTQISEEARKCHSHCDTVKGAIETLRGHASPNCKRELEATEGIIGALEEPLKQIENLTTVKEGVDRTINDSLGKVNETLQSTVTSSIEQVRNGWDKVRKAVNETQSLSGAVSTAAEQANNFLDKLFSFTINKNIKAGFSWLVTAPGLITLFFASFTAVPLLIYSYFPDNPNLIHCLFRFSMIGFYVMTILAGLVIAFSSVEYLGVSVTSSTCKTVLHDPTYSGLSCFNEEVVLLEGYKLNISLRGTLLSCKANNTLWKALKADSAFNTNSLSEMAKLSKIKNTVREKVGAVKEKVLSYQRKIDSYKTKAMEVDEVVRAPIDGLVESYSLQKCSGSEADEIKNSVKELFKSLQFFRNEINTIKSLLNSTVILQDNMLDERLNKISSRLFELCVETPVRQGFDDLLKNFSTELLPCRSVYNAYQNLGSMFCEDIAKPAHGVWAATGLCGLSILATAIVILVGNRLDSR
ncbi:unnamed protein product [Cylicocyclus nassatus]|uniref:Uncharacterized protein n=1 Tax=Cylicocyclus nassatus TaxID=53992 RepID=A0AA36GQL2_CYLNA|nr:unnamed protein product [Cylicocyclus nassatus]